MPRYRDGFPRPRKEYHHGAWRIAWRWDGKKYSASTAITDKANVHEIEILLRDLSRQLASNNRPVLSALWSSSPGVMRYVADRFGDEDAHVGVSAPAGWMDEYAREIYAECDEAWAKDSMSRLRKMEAAAGGFHAVTAKFASQYLADIAAERTPGTRNRALMIFSRFFKWAIRTGRAIDNTGQAIDNPFAGISQLPEPLRSDIVYCTPDERVEIIAFARATDWPDWLAVPIAFYAGMRREEISRLKWPDIRFSEGLIVVQESKTKKSRLIPLASALEDVLREIPENRRKEYVVVVPGEIDREYRMDNLVRHIRGQKETELLDGWSLKKPTPSRAKTYRDELAKWKEAMAEKQPELDSTLERIGWTPFRHTFGSLLAQAGVSIDKISAWMGNTPEVCRRHYAQFIPRDRRDSEIDKL